MKTRNQTIDAAVPQEITMFKVKMGMTESGKPYAAGIGVSVSQHLVAADRFGIELPKGFGKDAKEKADLLERRLSRLESELGLSPLDAR